MNVVVGLIAKENCFEIPFFYQWPLSMSKICLTESKKSFPLYYYYTSLYASMKLRMFKE